MKRYTLKCGQCGQIIGYMSLLVDSKDGKYVISRTEDMRKREGFPICCPACEVERIRKETEENESESRLES